MSMADNVEIRALGIYSEHFRPEKNYMIGREHHYSALTIGKQMNDAANLAEADAKKYRKQHRYDTAAFYERAERSFRASAAYAFKKHAEGVA